MSDLTVLSLGEIAYTGYRNSTGGKTWNGYEMPTWGDLPANVQAAWDAGGWAVQARTLQGVVVSLEAVLAEEAAERQAVRP